MVVWNNKGDLVRVATLGTLSAKCDYRPGWSRWFWVVRDANGRAVGRGQALHVRNALIGATRVLLSGGVRAGVAAAAINHQGRDPEVDSSAT